MKGLLRNNIYSMKTNLQTAFIIALICSIIPIFEKRILLIVLCVQFLVFIVNLGNSMSVDVNSRWNKFELTLPVKRNDIVNAKYLSFLILILLGLIMAIMTIAATLVTHPEVSITEVIFGIGLGFSVSTITISIAYPIMLKLGTEKNEIIIFLSTCVSFGIYLLITYIISEFNDGTIKHSENPIVALVALVVSVLFIIVSYRISICEYKKNII